jgi:hypothetical protein
MPCAVSCLRKATEHRGLFRDEAVRDHLVEDLRAHFAARERASDGIARFLRGALFERTGEHGQLGEQDDLVVHHRDDAIHGVDGGVGLASREGEEKECGRRYQSLGIHGVTRLQQGVRRYALP